MAKGIMSAEHIIDMGAELMRVIDTLVSLLANGVINVDGHQESVIEMAVRLKMIADMYVVSTEPIVRLYKEELEDCDEILDNGEVDLDSSDDEGIETESQLEAHLDDTDLDSDFEPKKKRSKVVDDSSDDSE